MISIKTLTIWAASKSSSSPKPMNIILSLILTALLVAMNTATKNNSPWPSIMMVMSINGGLMILYIFTISMTQQEKKEEYTFPIYPSIIIPMILSSQVNSSSKTQSPTETMFHSSAQSIMIMTATMMMIMTMVMKMSTNPFKTMKSS